jgi:hypothetical protein
MYQIVFTTAANQGVSILGSDPICLGKRRRITFSKVHWHDVFAWQRLSLRLLGTEVLPAFW